MASLMVVTLPRLSPDALSEILLEHSTSNLDVSTPPPHIAIIDVRDDDHIGGHIKHSTHVPSRSLDGKVPDLVQTLKDKKVVVFHCALSQERGPRAALKYIRERERQLKTGSLGEKSVGEVLKKNTDVEADKERKGEGEWEDVDGGKGQEVYVLDRGFVGWQEKYGEDMKLTEGYRKEIWKEGYWM